MARGNGQTKCVRLLAGTGKVDWNIRNKWGETPLFWALCNRHSDVVEIIVKISTDFSAAVNKALKLGYFEIVDVLCPGSRQEDPHPAGQDLHRVYPGQDRRGGVGGGGRQAAGPVREG